MDYFAQFLRSSTTQAPPKQQRDLAGDLHIAWTIIKAGWQARRGPTRVLLVG